MIKYVNVVIMNNSVHTDNLFTYKVQKELEDYVSLGHRILVPFGISNKPLEAFVFEILDEKPKDDIKYKNIIDVLDEKPILTQDKLELINWMRNRYICTYVDCINLMYPKGYRVEKYKVVYLNYESSLDNLNKSQNEIVEKLKLSKGKLKLNKFTKNIATIYNLKEKGVLDIKWEYSSLKNEKKISYLNLEIDKSELDLDSKRLGKKQKLVLEYLIDKKDVVLDDLLNNLDVSRQTIKTLIEKNYVKIHEEDYFREYNGIYDTKNKDIILNDEQNYAVNKIISGMFTEKKPYMIHGVTGSGKTEVYIKVIEYVLSQGLDCIVLVPEISLTPQTISRFRNKFSDIVGVFHSQLSDGERHDVYRKVENGSIRVLVGARSALFAPFKNLGLIIIDEFHESSYKSDKNPKFDTLEVSKYMAIKNNISLVVGSATPSIDEYYKAKNGLYNLIKINKRANKFPLPEIEVVDMKEELNRGNLSIFSNKLKYEIKNALDNNNQIILFLNRRGYSNFVFCRSCNHIIKCNNCDISLTYHKKDNVGICHYCGYQNKIPTKCPECDSIYLKPFGVGTQKIEEEIKSIFEGIKVLRLDKDTTSKKGSSEEILNKFKNKEADVLIGTQMLSKGLDFEDVTLVGILSADAILKSPNFKSIENTFQLITQVSGRAGRASKKGKVVLQTYDTNHYAITRAVDYDYENFYNDEIKIRKAFDYSPFRNIMRVVVSGENENLVKKNINSLHKSIVYLLNKRGIEKFDFILGPTECVINKINQNYRYQILFKDENIEINFLKGIIKYVCITKKDIVFDKNINVSIDINPNSLL